MTSCLFTPLLLSSPTWNVVRCSVKYEVLPLTGGVLLEAIFCQLGTEYNTVLQRSNHNKLLYFRGHSWHLTRAYNMLCFRQAN